MPRWLQVWLGGLLAAMVIGVPLAYSSYREKQLRNVRVVTEGVLYRSGQLTLDGLQRVIHDHGIRTVISLRDGPHPEAPPPDLAEEKLCRDLELRFYRIPTRRWWAADGSVPAEAGVQKFLAILDNSENYPVLLHCFAGRHRTGAHCAIYRMEYDHWTNAAALGEMKALGYINDDEDIWGYLEQYRPRWKGPAEAAVEGAEPPRAP